MTCFITACAQNVLLLHERRRWTVTPLANSTFNSARPRAANLLLMRHFSLSTYNIKLNIISVKYVTDFQWFCGVGNFLSWRMRYTVWISAYYCERPNYYTNSAFHTVSHNIINVRWAQLQPFKLTLSFFVMQHAKNYQNPLIFHGVIQKNSSGPVFETRCTSLAQSRSN